MKWIPYSRSRIFVAGMAGLGASIIWICHGRLVQIHSEYGLVAFAVAQVVLVAVLILSVFPLDLLRPRKRKIHHGGTETRRK